jgi:hypothetical protein
MTLAVAMMNAQVKAKAIQTPSQSRAFAALSVERARRKLRSAPAEPSATVKIWVKVRVTAAPATALRPYRG